MYFDYTIVLAFVLAGALLAVAGSLLRARPRRAQASDLDRPADADAPSGVSSAAQAEFALLFAVAILAAALALLFPCALVLRACLHDSGAAQSRGVGAWAVCELGLCLVAFGLALGYAHRQPGARPARPAEASAGPES